LLYVDPDGQAAFCLIPPITFACGAAVVIVGVVAVVVIGGVIVCSHTDCPSLFRGTPPLPVQASPKFEPSTKDLTLPQSRPETEATATSFPLPNPEPTTEHDGYKLATSPIADPNLDLDTFDTQGINLVNKSKEIKGWFTPLTTIAVTEHNKQLYFSAGGGGSNAVTAVKASVIRAGYNWVEPKDTKDHAEMTLNNAFKNSRGWNTKIGISNPYGPCQTCRNDLPIPSKRVNVFYKPSRSPNGQYKHKP
jgi:hypothetical protein